MSRTRTWIKRSVLTAGILAMTVVGASTAHADDATPASGGTTVRELIRDGVITRAEWKAVRHTTRSERQEMRDEYQAAALEPLVAAGTLTAAEAEHIASSPRRRGLHDLVRAGGVSRDEAAAVREALRNRQRAVPLAALREALTALISSGILTQEQADAIEEAVADRVPGDAASDQTT